MLSEVAAHGNTAGRIWVLELEERTKVLSLPKSWQLLKAFSQPHCLQLEYICYLISTVVILETCPLKM